MGRVLTNNTAYAYVVESALKTPGTTGWRTLEPDEVTKFGNEFKRTSRDPISKNRQKRAGKTTDLDSGVEMKIDLVISHFEDMLESFVMAVATNNDTKFEGVAAVSGGYTIPAATAAQAAKFQYTSGGPISLVNARGYATTANNGIKPLSADLVAAATTLAVAGNSAETAPTNAVVELGGIRAEAGDLALAVSGATGTLSSGNNSATNNIDFTTLGLTVGQMVHVGGLTDTYRFGSTAAGDGTRSYGYARVTAIAAAALTLDRMESTLVASDGTDDGTAGTLITMDLLFGRFVRNVAVDDTDYLEQSIHVEQSLPNLDSGGLTEYSYARGNYANEWTLELPMSDKAGMTMGFLGTDTQDPTTTRKTGASTAIEPVKTSMFSTSADIARLIVMDTDESGLTTDFKSMTLKIMNNDTGEKVLGTLGPKYINTGNFSVEIDSEILFTNGDVITRIRNATPVGLNFVLYEATDGAIGVDIPSLTLGDGTQNLVKNESVKIKLTGEAHMDTTLGTSLSVSLFPIAPAPDVA